MPKPEPKVRLHLQPGRQVVLTTCLPDGRVFRVCGRPGYGNGRFEEARAELSKMIRWESRK